MNLKQLLERVTAGFSRTRSVVAKSTDTRDIAVADIALMIAAMDGTVRAEEFSAYQQIARRCRGLTDAERRVHLDAAVCKAGRLLMMAQVGAYSEDQLLAAFGEAAHEVMPSGFAECSRTDVRRAFVLWVSAATADGEVSRIERQAIDRLKKTLTKKEIIEDGFLELAEQHLCDLGDPEKRSGAEAALDRLVVFGNN